ncbi:hypothetical protein [Acidomonas methanolica]|uniref:hypothetical protein n=1 Tax=Acidomonas methanolica TaxID=437 RepID=UPI00211A17A4|nr:hypothetical protein [Acidomonas methanolica]MCQ9155515.1 hypothetical protein [Acidomonas methanolica]
MRRVAALLLLLAGCSSSAPSRPQADPAMVDAMDLGRSAFDLARFDQSQTQYETAYRRALLSNDAAGLHDSAYDLAVARLAREDAKGALVALDRARADLALRGVHDLPDFDVVEAAAFYRLGAYDRAFDLAARRTDRGGLLGERAVFLTGMAADGLGRGDVLARCVGRLGDAPRTPLVERADHAELAARLHLRAGEASEALTQAVAASERRRAAGEYRGMARALRLAAQAARAGGQPGVAASYERIAAQSEAAQRK